MLKIQGALGQDDFRLGSSAKGGFEVTRIEYAVDADPGRERSWTRSDIAFRWWSKRRMPRWSEAGACR